MILPSQVYVVQAGIKGCEEGKMSFESQQSLLFFPRYSLLIYHLEREKKNHNYRIFFWRETQHTTPEEGATDTEKVREGRRRRREKRKRRLRKRRERLQLSITILPPARRLPLFLIAAELTAALRRRSAPRNAAWPPFCNV